MMFVVKPPTDKGYASKTLRLPVELIDKAEKVAKDNNVSFNNLVKQALEYALNDMEGK